MLSIEDAFFREKLVDTKYLKEKLIDSNKGLRIPYVILEMPNCEKLAKWFLKELKVDEVIYFEVKKEKNHKLDPDPDYL